MSPAAPRVIAIAAGILVYSLLEHHSNTTGSGRLGAALAIAPWIAALLLAAWRMPWRRLGAAAVLAVCAPLVLWGWPRLQHDFPLLLLLQQTGVYCALAAAFGRSLLPRAVPLCTRWAGAQHGPLPPAAQRYTRAVTLAWSVFFVVIALLGVLLYLCAPRSVWSFYASFLTLPLTALMFAAEYAVRRRCLPQMCTGLWSTVRCYFDAEASERATIPETSRPA